MGPYLSSGAQESRAMTDDEIVPIKKVFIGASSIVRVVPVLYSYAYQNGVFWQMRNREFPDLMKQKLLDDTVQPKSYFTDLRK
jgi:hypothetical protein